MGQLKNSLYIFILFSIDFLVIFFSHEIAYFIRETFFSHLADLQNNNIEKYFFINFIILVLLVYEKIYTLRFDFWRETKKIYTALFYSFIFIFTILSLLKAIDSFSRSYLILFFMTLFLVLPLVKRVVKNLLFRIDFFREKIKVIVKDEEKSFIKDELINNWYLGYKIVKNNYQSVIIYSKGYTVLELNKILDKYSENIHNIFIVPFMHHIDFSHNEIVDFFNIRVSAFQIQNRLLDYKNILIKNIVEKILIVLFFPFIIFLHILFVFLIKRDSSGKVLFKQRRLGKNGKVFNCYKYRTMYEDNEDILKDYLKDNPDEKEYYEKYHKYKNDPRVTKIGKLLRKTSLDELPQFYNILNGEMSLIGPRPYMVEEKKDIDEYNINTILKVKPGITGLWQVSGRNNLSFKERTELDIWYIQNWSLWLDFVVFLKTIKVVLFKVGAR